MATEKPSAKVVAGYREKRIPLPEVHFIETTHKHSGGALLEVKLVCYKCGSDVFYNQRVPSRIPHAEENWHAQCLNCKIVVILDSSYWSPVSRQA